jgi:hypothetical protein|tara:strand:- start:28 stop:441 length:414 start_codon:yes stop_codon:yes gene_type:complete
MATTASITLTSDITGDATNLTSTATLTKADSNVTGLDQFTGVTTLVFSAAQSDKNIIAAADYADTTVAHKVYIRNANTSGTKFVTVDIDSSANEPLGRLYPGDWCFFPYDGTLDIDIDTSDAGVTVEFAVISQSAAS